MRLARRKLQMIFQDPYEALDPRQNAYQTLLEPLLIHRAELSGGERDHLIYKYLNAVGLHPAKDMAERYPHNLSGGQRQRAAIALALACSPRLLIADEPTSSTDVQVQKQLIDLIAGAAAKRDIGVLFISHDIAIVSEIAERILVMKDGVIVENGLAGELIFNPQHEYTKLLVHCARQMDLALKAKGA
jgi:peptide/nickel transport system ATP-binding protein